MNMNRLFFLSLKNGNNGSEGLFSGKYYIPLVEVKDFNTLITINCLKNFEKLIKISKNNDYTTENLLYCSYHLNYYKLIDIDKSRQANKSILQEINFTFENHVKVVNHLLNIWQILMEE